MSPQRQEAVIVAVRRDQETTTYKNTGVEWHLERDATSQV